VEGDGLSNRQRAIDTAPNVRQGLRLELLSVIVSTGIVAFQFSLARKNDMREWRARLGSLEIVTTGIFGNYANPRSHAEATQDGLRL
jgi:hypothetical protein